MSEFEAFVEEKPALLRLRIKVYLGMKGFPQNSVWDEPTVLADEVKLKPKPDLIVIRDEGIWWWEMKDWKSAVNAGEITKIFRVIDNANRANALKFISKDGNMEISDKKVTAATLICGKGGFTQRAIALVREYSNLTKFDLKKPDELGVQILQRKSVGNGKLLAMEIRVIPKGSMQTLVVPKEMQTP